MKTNLRRVAAVFALLFATQSVTLLGPATDGGAGNPLGRTLSAVAGSPQEAEAASYTVRFHNSTRSVSALTICKDWGDTACGSGSPRGYLSAGQSSHLKYPSWTDVDGFYVPGDQKATYTKLTLGRTVSGPAWVKVSDCGGCNVVVTLRWK